MTNILVYDYEAKEIEKIADANDISIAGVVEEMLEYFQQALNEDKTIQ